MHVVEIIAVSVYRRKVVGMSFLLPPLHDRQKNNNRIIITLIIMVVLYSFIDSEDVTSKLISTSFCFTNSYILIL